MRRNWFGRSGVQKLLGRCPPPHLVIKLKQAKGTVGGRGWPFAMHRKAAGG